MRQLDAHFKTILLISTTLNYRTKRRKSIVKREKGRIIDFEKYFPSHHLNLTNEEQNCENFNLHSNSRKYRWRGMRAASWRQKMRKTAITNCFVLSRSLALDFILCPPPSHLMLAFILYLHFSFSWPPPSLLAHSFARFLSINLNFFFKISIRVSDQRPK